MMKFVLEGIGGVYNYGCEAIVRGTAQILRRTWPGCTITYHSYRPEPDRRALQDVALQVQDGIRLRRTLWRRADQLARVLRPLLRVQKVPSYVWARDADCILSIGGDLLTLMPSERNASAFHQPRHLNAIFEYGVPTVLWGASVGPFEENPHAPPVFRDALDRFVLVTVRERVTADYLRQLGVSAPTALVADPAYLMAPAEPGDPQVGALSPRGPRKTFAVNLSPLSLLFAHGESDRQEAVAAQAHLIEAILNVHDVDVLLVPHVICPWHLVDDDLSHLEKIKDAIAPEVRDRVRCLPGGLGARRTKAILSRCHALMAARMHCAIAGVSAGVPTLFLGYSDKSKGMAEFVYGDRTWLAQVDAPQADLLAKVGGLLGDADALRKYLGAQAPRFEREAVRAGTVLAEILKVVPANMNRRAHRGRS